MVLYFNSIPVNIIVLTIINSANQFVWRIVLIIEIHKAKFVSNNVKIKYKYLQKRIIQYICF